MKIEDGFVSETNTEQIKKFINNYIDGLPSQFDGITPGRLREIIYKGADAYFNKSLFEFMPNIKLNLLKHTKQAAYYPFKNGVVKITKNKKELLTSLLKNYLGLTMKSYEALSLYPNPIQKHDQTLAVLC